MKQVVENYIKILTNRNYSNRTIETYVCYLERFLNDINVNPYHITLSDIKTYLRDTAYTSCSHQNQVIGSIKLYAKYILNKKEIHLDKIERPKKEKKLPLVIESEYLKETILSIKNLKHKAILSLGYGCMLRVSEVLNLKITDIDSKRMLITIKNAKGRKDRIVVLSETLLTSLRAYYKKYQPKEYLFNGAVQRKYSATSCNKLVKKYLGNSYHFHTLRHSGATTMLENGNDLASIQKLLGHTNIKTTMIYTHVSQAHLQNIKPIL